jgi:hypothetical protein
LLLPLSSFLPSTLPSDNPSFLQPFLASTLLCFAPTPIPSVSTYNQDLNFYLRSRAWGSSLALCTSWSFTLAPCISSCSTFCVDYHGPVALTKPRPE